MLICMPPDSSFPNHGSSQVRQVSERGKGYQPIPTQTHSVHTSAPSTKYSTLTEYLRILQELFLGQTSGLRPYQERSISHVTSSPVLLGFTGECYCLGETRELEEQIITCVTADRQTLSCRLCIGTLTRRRLTASVRDRTSLYPPRWTGLVRLPPVSSV